MVLTIAIVFVDQTYIAGMTGRPHSESLTVDMLFFSAFALPAISIIRGGLGIAGLLFNDRGKKLVWVSIAGNAVVLVLVCAFLALARLFEGYGTTP